jgi:hypothetical protein
LDRTRDAVHHLSQQAKAQTVQPILSGDMGADKEVQQQARMLEELLKSLLFSLAYLRKAALDSAKAGRGL